MTETRNVYKLEEKLRIVLERSVLVFLEKIQLTITISDDHGRKSTADLRTIEEQRMEIAL